jgi:hypothetical protein
MFLVEIIIVSVSWVRICKHNRRIPSRKEKLANIGVISEQYYDIVTGFVIDYCYEL